MLCQSFAVEYFIVFALAYVEAYECLFGTRLALLFHVSSDAELEFSNPLYGYLQFILRVFLLSSLVLGA